MVVKQNNYWLKELKDLQPNDTLRFADPDQVSVLESILRLNKAGRRYLKDHLTSIAKGVQVFSTVNENKSKRGRPQTALSDERAC
jgi:hypothetical protein